MPRFLPHLTGLSCSHEGLLQSLDRAKQNNTITARAWDPDDLGSNPTPTSLSMPPFPHLKSGDDKSTPFAGFYEDSRVEPGSVLRPVPGAEETSASVQFSDHHRYSC